MKVMERSNDGFKIAEKDLQLRGPGDFFGTRQHGLPELRIANLYEDRDILKQSQEVAKKILKEDRQFKQEENYQLKESLIKNFKDKLKDIILN